MTAGRRPTRRQFLAAAAATVAAPYFVPAKAFGANDRVNIGYIGCGRRAGGLQGIPGDAHVVALADVNKRRLEEWAKGRLGREYGITEDRLFQDYRDMLALDELDAVMISSPDHWHALHSIHAMEAGKDVYVEKPMTLTIREGRLMADAARANNRICQVGSQQRSMRANRIGCALIRSGRIGKVHTVHAANFPSPWECTLPEEDAPEHIDWDMWCGPTPYRGYHDKLYTPRGGQQGHEWGWISFRPYSGGEMTGWGAHGLDQIQWALGMDNSGPVAIWPLLDEEPEFDGVHRGPRYPVCMKYANGTLVILDDKGAGGGGWFEGDEGEVKIDRNRYAVKPENLDAELPELEPIPFEGDTNEHIANWLHCIRTRQTSNADVEIGHRSTTVCHLGNIARWLKREIKWDPVSETFPGDDEANAYLDRERRAPWTLA